MKNTEIRNLFGARINELDGYLKNDPDNLQYEIRRSEVIYLRSKYVTSHDQSLVGEPITKQALLDRGFKT